jgi:hypothetical protein
MSHPESEHSGKLPVGKLPPALLESLLRLAPTTHPDLLVGPGIGLDCAVIDQGDRLLVCKSDPVTFVTEDPGRYLVRVNANDVATTGAVPRWLMVTLLLPEGRADYAMAERIMGQIGEACRGLGITLVGGHTEVTHGLAHPVAVGALLGEVDRDRLVTPRGARVGDRVLLTKGVPIEGTAILAGEFGDRLRGVPVGNGAGCRPAVHRGARYQRGGGCPHRAGGGARDGHARPHRGRRGGGSLGTGPGEQPDPSGGPRRDSRAAAGGPRVRGTGARSPGHDRLGCPAAHRGARGCSEHHPGSGAGLDPLCRYRRGGRGGRGRGRTWEACSRSRGAMPWLLCLTKPRRVGNSDPFHLIGGGRHGIRTVRHATDQPRLQ